LRSLELNIHQRILSDIASKVAGSADDVEFAKDTIAAKVQTRAEPDEGEQLEVQERVFMVCAVAASDFTQTHSSSLHLGFTATSPSGSL
jgi:hypothetical protein